MVKKKGMTGKKTATVPRERTMTNTNHRVILSVSDASKYGVDIYGRAREDTKTTIKEILDVGMEYYESMRCSRSSEDFRGLQRSSEDFRGTIHCLTHFITLSPCHHPLPRLLSMWHAEPALAHSRHISIQLVTPTLNHRTGQR